MSALEPVTQPHGLPVVPPSTALAPRHAAPVEVHRPGDDLAAMKAAVAVWEMARAKGLPDPQQVRAVAGYVEVSLLVPHWLQWIGVLDRLGHVKERERPDFDPADKTKWYPQVWVTALPNHKQRDYSLHGWTGGKGTIPHQQWVLVPVDGRPRSYDDLPEPAREFSTVEAWFAGAWHDLVGKRRWEEQSWPRASADLTERWEAAHAELDAKIEQARAQLLRPTPRPRTAVTS